MDVCVQKIKNNRHSFLQQTNTYWYIRYAFVNRFLRNLKNYDQTSENRKNCT